MTRLLETNKATLGIYDQTAITAALQHLSGLRYAHRMILTALRRSRTTIRQEKYHRQTFRHTASLCIKIFASTLYGKPQWGATSRTNILHQVCCPLSTMRERQAQLRFILCKCDKSDLITLSIRLFEQLDDGPLDKAHALAHPHRSRHIQDE